MSKANPVSLISPNLLIAPLGGCGEFGMNTTAYIYRKKLYLVDAGIMFPDPRKLGVASIMPDISSIVEQFKGVEAYIITHGHEDHIGALPFFYKKWPAPIYATPWTCGLIERKFNEHQLDLDSLHMVGNGDTVTCQGISFTYFPVHHSIPDACALAIETKESRILHTGDFKIELNPIEGQYFDKRAWKEFGKRGVDLLIADSTNSQRPGRCPNELDTIEDLTSCIKTAHGRCFITTFASNLWRVKIILDVCKKLKKRVIVAGRGMQNTIELAESLGYLTVDPGLIISEEQLPHVNEKNLVILVSGSQGEFRSALWRITLGEHSLYSFKPTDRVIFSARVIPGNERSVYTLVSEIENTGAEVVSSKTHPKLHVSGHAYQDELREVLQYIRPRYYMPVHGGYSQLIANQKLGREVGLKKHNVISIKDGEILQVTPNKVGKYGMMEIPRLYVEQDCPSVIDHDTLRERLRIGENGLALISGCFSKSRKKWLVEPVLLQQGLHLPVSAEWISKSLQQLAQAMTQTKRLTQNDCNEFARLFMRKKISPVLQRKPVVLSQIILVD